MARKTIKEILTMNNSTFAKTVKSFISACIQANIEPTKRQASKWRNKKGLAYKTANPS